jgi:hypothetical protein
MALREAGERARGATVYVTLEPCNHHGRTAPCTEALLRAGVARVVFAVPDPNPHVRGHGREMLRGGGVVVEEGFALRGFQREAERLIAPWMRFITSGRPRHPQGGDVPRRQHRHPRRREPVDHLARGRTDATATCCGRGATPCWWAAGRCSPTTRCSRRATCRRGATPARVIVSRGPRVPLDLASSSCHGQGDAHVGAVRARRRGRAARAAALAGAAGVTGVPVACSPDGGGRPRGGLRALAARAWCRRSARAAAGCMGAARRGPGRPGGVLRRADAARRRRAARGRRRRGRDARRRDAAGRLGR